MASRTQRYRLTFEFILRDRGDYALYREMFRAAINKVCEGIGIQADYLAIDKVEEDK